MKKILIFALAMLCSLSILTACGQKKDAGGQTEDGKDTAAEEQTISGIINRLGEYLVLLDENSEYHIFDFDEAVDLSSLEEGDSVTVTYTGTLDSDDPAPVAITIEKAG